MKSAQACTRDGVCAAHVRSWTAYKSSQLAHILHKLLEFLVVCSMTCQVCGVSQN